MNAVLAIIADSGQAIVDEVVEINVFLIYFIFYTKPFVGSLVQPLLKRPPGMVDVHP
jgi:hypothetical protein